VNSFSSVASAWKPGWLTRALSRFDRPDARFTDEEILTVIRAGEGLRVADVCAAADIPVETFYTWKARYGGLSLEALRDERRSERRKTRAKKFALTVVVLGAVAGAAVLVATLSRPPAIDSAATAPPRANDAPAPVAVDGNKPATPGNMAQAPDPNAAPSSSVGGSHPDTSASAADSKPTGAGGIPPEAPSRPTPGAQSSTATGPGAKPALPSMAATQKPAAPVATAGSRAPASSPASPTQAQGSAPDIVTAAPEGISVQVGAFPDLGEARTAVSKLKNAGYPAYMMVTVLNQNELYRVRVGPLKSRELAQMMAQRLEREGYAAPWITSR